MRTFDSEATLTVCEGYDVTEEQEHLKRDAISLVGIVSVRDAVSVFVRFFCSSS